MKNIVIHHGAARETKFNVFRSVSCLDGVHHFTADTSLGLYKVTVTDENDNFIRRYNTHSKTTKQLDQLPEHYRINSAVRKPLAENETSLGDLLNEDNK